MPGSEYRNSVSKLTHTSILILAAALLLGAGWTLTRSGLDREKNLRTEEHIVVLTKDGFSPMNLTIKKGETVIFSTSLGNHFWPASNYHPTHALFPEFDPRHPIPPNENWDFKFEKAGTWRYHDHLTPYLLGTILVEE